MSTPPRFQRGGSLHGSSATYIEREADRRLVEALSRGDYCLLFAPRQVGKSSLWLRAGAALQAQGIRTGFVDLNAIGASALEEDWYFSVASEIAGTLGLDAELQAAWSEQPEGTTPAWRFRHCMRHVVLARIDGPVVVFIDETDVTLSLPFSRDDFFAEIRTMYNERPSDSAWERLCFCLIGVMSRDDLIQDPARTPFNIEHTEIRLSDFSRAEMQAFAAGLDHLGADTDALLDAVHTWTDGHPALSQRLCWELVEKHQIARGDEAAVVDELVAALFIQRGRETDPVLGDTARRFDGAAASPLASRMLELYGRVLRGERVQARGDALGPDGARMLARLRIAGLVRESEDGYLAVRNRIVETVFDDTWVRSILAERRLGDDLRRWLESGRSRDNLLRGQRLRAAAEWIQGRHDVTDEERDFVLESERSEARARRRLLLGFGGLILLLAVALGIALWQYRKAEERRVEAENAQREARETAQRNAELAQEAKDALMRAEEARTKAEKTAQRNRELAQEAQEALARAKEAQSKAEKTAQRNGALAQEVKDALVSTERARQEAEQAARDDAALVHRCRLGKFPL